MEGEALQLPGDHRLGRVIQITRQKVRLIFDSRSQPKFRWLWKSELSFDFRQWIEWPVYSIHGVARAIRHTAFAPGDLYLDNRGEEDIGRPLSDQEKWNGMELSIEKSKVLDKLELSHEKGQLAGNSITGRMASTVAGVVGGRVAAYQRHRSNADAGGFSLLQPDVCIRSPAVTATLLVVLSLAAQPVLAWDQLSTPGTVSALDQASAFKMACQWAEDLGYEDATSKCIPLEKPAGCSVARAVIYYELLVEAAEGSQIVAIHSILDKPLGALAVGALAQVGKMRGIVTVRGGNQAR